MVPYTQVQSSSAIHAGEDAAYAQAEATLALHRADWECDAMGQWVAISGAEFVGPFPTMRNAMTGAHKSFGERFVLLVQIGETQAEGELPSIEA